jgi:UDP-N-acetylglucosamine 2-epimerase (non-hydrolysing)
MPTKNQQKITAHRRPETRMRLMLIAGARPNFMKIASIIDAIKEHNDSIENSKLNIQHSLVHTGQHYDDAMSDAFFRDLDLPKPDIYLEVGSGSHAAQTAKIMKRFEPTLLKHQPDAVIVVGDVNSTVACALVASKIQYGGSTQNSKLITHNSKFGRPLIAHVEAGLRSFDRTMPEEINRLLTDAISDFLFTTEESANENLRREGVPKDRVFFVGNTMIDTLLKHKQMAQKSTILNKLCLSASHRQRATSNQILPYAVVTLHRPSNVDNRETFANILEALLEVSKHIPIMFPAHPRTLNRIKEFDFEKYFNFPPHALILKPQSSRRIGSLASNLQPLACGLHCVEPLGYLDFLCLMSNSKLVLTDSGGMQEETTVLGIPCITLRENTERPVTTTSGTNVLAGVQIKQIISAALSQLKEYSSTPSKSVYSTFTTQPSALNPQPSTFNTQHSTLGTQYSASPPLWDGQAGQRIVDILVDRILKR